MSHARLRIISNRGQLLAPPDDPGAPDPHKEHLRNLARFKPRWYQDMGGKMLVALAMLVLLPFSIVPSLRNLFRNT